MKNKIALIITFVLFLCSTLFSNAQVGPKPTGYNLNDLEAIRYHPQTDTMLYYNEHVLSSVELIYKSCGRGSYSFHKPVVISGISYRDDFDPCCEERITRAIDVAIVVFWGKDGWGNSIHLAVIGKDDGAIYLRQRLYANNMGPLSEIKIIRGANNTIEIKGLYSKVHNSNPVPGVSYSLSLNTMEIKK